jgi:phosphoribosylanthranilate isomerase
MVKVQVFSMMSISDAELVAGTGADHVGFQVSAGNIPYTVDTRLGRSICEVIKPSAKAVMIPISRDQDEILELARVVEPDIVQLANAESMMSRQAYSVLLNKLENEGFVTIKVIAVGSGNELETAMYYAGKSSLLMLDTYGNPPSDLLRGFIGGTGKTNDWKLSRKIVESVEKPVILAGGLNLNNVASAIEEVKPWGVDAASGLSIPSSQGKKDIEKVRKFVEIAKGIS